MALYIVYSGLLTIGYNLMRSIMEIKIQVSFVAVKNTCIAELNYYKTSTD